MISLTETAASEIQAALSDKGLAGYGLRLQIVGGGCEGFLYDLLYVDSPDPGDRVFESHGVRLFVDPRTYPAVDGVTIDHRATSHGLGFVFTNPRARSTCSCGASFGT